MYGNRNNATGLVAEPSAKTKREMDAGAKAQGTAGGYKEQPVSAADVAGQHAKEVERNLRADEQIERVTGGVELKTARK